MKLEPLPPVPVTPRVLWEQFRHRIIPGAMFLGLVALSVYLWLRVNSTAALPGIAEGHRALIISPEPGLIMELKVRPYQLVNQGDPIAVVKPMDPRMSLDLLQAELQLAKLRYEPSPAEQNAIEYQRVRVELLRLKSELAVARVNLRRAENELQRNLSLFRDKLVSEDIYDLSVQTREAFQAEVTQKDAAVRDLEQRVEELRTLGDPRSNGTNSQLNRMLVRLEEAHARAAANWGSLTLTAPMTGMVAPLPHQPGEYILAGEALASIQSLWSDRLVAYLRQPYTIDPEIGMEVRVRTRSSARQQFSVSVSRVGAQVEVITNALAFVRQGALVDVGLPIIMDLPPQTRIRPGEQVDLWFSRSSPSGAAQARAPSL